jgi:dienelactone hydrolase
MRTIGLFLVVMLAAVAAKAEIVTLTMPNKLVAQAEYLAGQPGKPAVLIQHGFLQTHDFPTVSRLAQALHGEGYTVLAPTMTLGVPFRKQSLACEAMHTHTRKDDFRELDTWLKWLVQKGHFSFVAVGHSQGSTELLAYLLAKPVIPASRFIAVSIIDVNTSRDPKVNNRIETELRGRVARGDRSPVTYPLSFCPKLTATAESILSYQEWSPKRILDGVKSLRIPVSLIMGGNDDRLGPSWIEQLRKTGKKVHVIEGANHFLDGQHEFDLLDLVLADLK